MLFDFYWVTKRGNLQQYQAGAWRQSIAENLRRSREFSFLKYFLHRTGKIFNNYCLSRDWTIQWKWKTIISNVNTKYPALVFLNNIFAILYHCVYPFFILVRLLNNILLSIIKYTIWIVTSSHSISAVYSINWNSMEVSHFLLAPKKLSIDQPVSIRDCKQTGCLYLEQV